MPVASTTRAQHHGYAYDGTFMWKPVCAGSISTKEIPIKGISPAKHHRCRGNLVRPHACTTHVRIFSRVYAARHADNIVRVYVRTYVCICVYIDDMRSSKTAHSLHRITNVCSCTRSHTSRKRNVQRVGGGWTTDDDDDENDDDDETRIHVHHIVWLYSATFHRESRGETTL